MEFDKIKKILNQKKKAQLRNELQNWTKNFQRRNANV